MGELMTGWNRQNNRIAELEPELEFSFDNVTPDKVKEIAEWSMRRDDALVEMIVEAKDLTWESVGEPLNELCDGGIFSDQASGFMAYVHTNKEVRDMADEMGTTASQHSNALWYRDDLYQKLKAYAESPDAQALTGEKARLIEHTMRDLKHMGHELDQESKDKMKELKDRLIDLSTKFEQNIREDKTIVTLTPEELDGLSDAAKEKLEKDDEGNYKLEVGKYPQVKPFMSQATNREARRKVFMAGETRLLEENLPIMAEAAKIRQEIASIMGYESWAHYVLEDCIAKTPDTVHEFYNDIIEPLTEKAKEELEVLTQMLNDDGHEGPLHRYDFAYYDNKQRQALGIDKEKVAEYLPLDACMEGFTIVCEEAFGIKVKQLEGVTTWYDDDTKGVITLELSDIESGEKMATYHMDLFPRDGKYSHAAEFTLQSGRRMPDGSYRHPIAAIACNFTPPTKDKPSLVEYDEAETFIHENGHGLHDMATETELPAFSGTNVERDFVESISQIMEHWMQEPEFIRRFAKHYKTGEQMPVEMLEKLIEAQKLNIGYQMLRQVSFGMMDLAIHDQTPDKDLDRINRMGAEVSLMPYEEGTNFLATFGHLLGGYDANYNGYLRSEARGDDMYTPFEEQGIMNAEVGMRFRKIFFGRGGSMDGDDMTTEFLGRPTNNQAFFKKLGITPKS